MLVLVVMDKFLLKDYIIGTRKTKVENLFHSLPAENIGVNKLAKFCIAKMDRTGISIPLALCIYLPGNKFQPTSVTCHARVACVGRGASAVRSML